MDAILQDSDFLTVNTQKDTKEIVGDILNSEKSILAIPPRFEEAEVTILPPPSNSEKYIGLFSSGSTGEPKCLWNKQSNLNVNAEISVKAFSIQRNDRLLILASPWHVAGLSWAAMAEVAGSSWEIVTPYVKNSAQWIDIIKNFNPTLLLTVPSVLRYLAEYDNWFVPRIAFGGASLDQGDYELLKGHCDSVIQAYGQTEAGGLISLSERKLSDANPKIDFNDVGKAPSEFEITCLGTMEKPDTVFLTSSSSVSDEKYDTGDLGFFDENGNLHLTGRKNDSSGNCNMITAVTSVAHK